MWESLIEQGSANGWITQGWLPALVAGGVNLIGTLIVFLLHRKSEGGRQRSERRTRHLGVLQQAQIEMDRLHWASPPEDGEGNAIDAAVQFDHQKTQQAEGILNRARPAVPDSVMVNVDAACRAAHTQDNLLQQAMGQVPPDQVQINRRMAELLKAKHDYRDAMKEAVTTAYHETVSKDA